jgi:hypothetical protein
MSDKEHDDVELLLEGTSNEIMEVISGEPDYYIPLVESYRKMRDGRDIYLPDLFNIIVERNKDSRRIQKIKFKMGDNEPWNEVGYSEDKYSDQDTYSAFSEKVANLLRYPVTQSRRRAAIQDTMLDSGEPGASANDFLPDARCEGFGQGNQNVVTKIDRFMGRAQRQETPSLASDAEIAYVKPSTKSKRPADKPPATKSASKDDLLPSILVDYRKALFQKLKSAGAGSILRRTLAIIDSTDKHVVAMRNRLPELDAGQRIVMLNYIETLFNRSTPLTSEDLLALLSAEDRQIVKDYKIDLLSLWQNDNN